MYVVHIGTDRVEGDAESIARLLADVAVPVSPGEIDNVEAAPAMLEELCELGFISSYKVQQ